MIVCFSLVGQTDRGAEETPEPFGGKEGDNQTGRKVTDNDAHQVANFVHRNGQRRSSEVGSNDQQEKERLRRKFLLCLQTSKQDLKSDSVDKLHAATNFSVYHAKKVS